MTNRGELRRTALYDCHLEAGARMVGFAGWEMPVQYAGLMAEHEAVRTAAGLFDVSHMGEVRIQGPDAEAFLQYLTPNNVAKLKVGRAHYSALLTEEGTYIDDLLIYRLADDDFLVVVNAANVDGDFAWIHSHAEAFSGEVTARNVSDDYALLALQGPRAVEILSQLTESDLEAIRYYRFAHGEVDGVPAILSRTGYTGEDGFELYLAPEHAAQVWRALLAAGADRGLQPAGLGARDSLRLEAAMALYGHEIDNTTTPWEAGLDWTVKLKAGDFIGRDALVAQQEKGIERKLVGFVVTGRGIAREGHGVVHGGETVGKVTSGTFSPTFKQALGLAYVPVELAEPGTALTLEVRGREIPAEVRETPFYRRDK
ncbi:MAG: glycine cleavage system aminomethyltransferase GcvT [Acidobacteriota bacterium]|nr:glycine cleavage system aminomethyltransferase GcvT [Acidobacteriota bacterium]